MSLDENHASIMEEAQALVLGRATQAC
jgi:hypothetical protein